jgi:hypothetical protein
MGNLRRGILPFAFEILLDIDDLELFDIQTKFPVLF